MKFTLGILVFAAAIALPILMMTGFGAWGFIFVELVTLFVFTLVIVAVIVITGEAKTFVITINALLSKQYYISAADKEKGIRLYKLIGKTVIYAVIVFSVIHLIIVLSTLDTPASIGPNIAMTLLTVFYGAIINMVFINPAVNILETRYNAEERTVISERQVIDKMLELCYKQGISPDEIVNADEIAFKQKQ